MKMQIVCRIFVSFKGKCYSNIAEEKEVNAAKLKKIRQKSNDIEKQLIYYD